MTPRFRRAWQRLRCLSTFGQSSDLIEAVYFDGDVDESGSLATRLAKLGEVLLGPCWGGWFFLLQLISWRMAFFFRLMLLFVFLKKYLILTSFTSFLSAVLDCQRSIEDFIMRRKWGRILAWGFDIIPERIWYCSSWRKNPIFEREATSMAPPKKTKNTPQKKVLTFYTFKKKVYGMMWPRSYHQIFFFRFTGWSWWAGGKCLACGQCLASDSQLRSSQFGSGALSKWPARCRSDCILTQKSLRANLPSGANVGRLFLFVKSLKLLFGCWKLVIGGFWDQFDFWKLFFLRIF